MMDIKTRLTRCCGKPVGGYKCGDGIRCPDCFDKLQGWREIEELRNEVEKWKRLEREAATHVEIVICMKSRHFTGEEPYVGWKGLGLALSQDYDDLERLREALKTYSCDCQTKNDCLANESNPFCGWAARAALKETE